MSNFDIARAASAQPTGEIMTMPELSAAVEIRIDDKGLIQGLF